ncbi:hypothetical protein [Microbulbifer magnicolonia]|uniref:hypothetical protein n=1 Tax=Microbulbifer magnicolonia TaxID=3109744 RepID=UPI002B401585|nr:hypothetical protein [Microbulbifer sp. GG15]
MFEQNKKTALFLSLLLTACGGGGGSDSSSSEPPVNDPPPSGSSQTEEPVSYVASGKAIDGYIVGATAWLDINGNGVLDDDEPSALTEAGGDYSLELTEAQNSCLPYSTLYVDVPEGAIDESEGEVQAAYQLAFPPSLDAEKTENIMVTPLTTAVWNSVVVALTDAGYSLSCDALVSNETLRNRITDAVEGGVQGVVQHYNIPAEKIYQDYIADADSGIQEKAKAIVAGLQASLAETLTARQEYPEADFILVQYYMGSHLDGGWEHLPEQWYRDQKIWQGNTNSHRVARVSADFSEEGALIMSSKGITEIGENYRWNDGSVWESRNGDGIYVCERSKGIEWSGFTVGTLYDMSSATDEKSCREGALVVIKNQYNFVSYSGDSVEFTSQFSFDGIELNPLSGAIDDAKLAAFESAILDLPYRWEDSGTGGAAWVARNRSESFDDGETAMVRTTRVEYVDGSTAWTRITNFRDGTHSNECSDDGELWQNCSG